MLPRVCNLLGYGLRRTMLTRSSYRRFNVQSFSQKTSSYERVFIAIGSCGSLLGGYGMYYVYTHPKEVEPVCNALPLYGMLVLVIIGTGLFAYYGPTRKATKLGGIHQFMFAPAIQQRIISAMRNPPASFNMTHHKEVLIPSRYKNVDWLYGKIVRLFGSEACLTGTGMKGIGKTQLLMEVASKLRENGYPTLYVQIGRGAEGSILDNILTTMDIYEDIAAYDIEWNYIHKAIWNACSSIDGGNVLIFDQLSVSSPYLREIEELSRRLGEANPNTVVFMMTSDSSDVFGLKSEPRRTLNTIQPFTDEQIADYLATAKQLSDGDVQLLLDVIKTKYTYSLVEINELIRTCTTRYGNENKIDFEQVDDFIATSEEYLIAHIRAICGDDETRKQLKQFVSLKGSSSFRADEFEDIFNALTDKASVGYKLLDKNWLLYIVEKHVLVFHAPIIRNAIAKII